LCGVETLPATAVAAVPIGEDRAVAGPSASGVPSFARIGARFGTVVCLTSCSPVRSPGNTRFGAQSTFPPSSGSTRSRRISPNACVVSVIGTEAADPPSESDSDTSPASTCFTVAVSCAFS
jgi:hypothetical protein